MSDSYHDAAEDKLLYDIDRPTSADECEHDYSKRHVCLKCGHAETWGEYMKRMEKQYAAYISR